MRGRLAVQMAEEEFSQLLAVVHTLAPKRCLEWGSGGSTRALLERCDAIECYVSIEHDRAWYDRVRAEVHDARLELHLVPPEPGFPCPARWKRRIRAWDARAELEPAILAGYVGLPARLGGSFDFVLVDGRARRFCLKVGFALLRPGGVLALHDAQRPEYRDVLFSLGPPELLEPWSRGQLALLRKPAG